MTDEKNKGNGEPEVSQITITFTGPGIADQVSIKPQGIVTDGQLAAATLQMFFMYGWRVFQTMGLQAQREAQQQAEIRSIIRSAKK